MPDSPSALLDELLDVDGRDVLDIGCGEGALVRRFASAGAHVIGLDPLPGALERARLEDPAAPPGRYLLGDAQKLPFAEGSFDVAVFFNSLHHVPLGSMDAALEQAARVLRPGGVLYVQEPLADGTAFELLRAIDDETSVRDAAQEALARAAHICFLELVRRDLRVTVRHTDFAALRSRMVSVHPDRAAAIDEQEPALRADFARLGRPVSGGYEFEQPLRVTMYRR